MYMRDALLVTGYWLGFYNGVMMVWEEGFRVNAPIDASPLTPSFYLYRVRPCVDLSPVGA